VSAKGAGGGQKGPGLKPKLTWTVYPRLKPGAPAARRMRRNRIRSPDGYRGLWIFPMQMAPVSMIQGLRLQVCQAGCQSCSWQA